MTPEQELQQAVSRFRLRKLVEAIRGLQRQVAPAHGAIGPVSWSDLRAGLASRGFSLERQTPLGDGSWLEVWASDHDRRILFGNDEWVEVFCRAGGGVFHEEGQDEEDSVVDTGTRLQGGGSDGGS